MPRHIPLSPPLNPPLPPNFRPTHTQPIENHNAQLTQLRELRADLVEADFLGDFAAEFDQGGFGSGRLVVEDDLDVWVGGVGGGGRVGGVF